MRHGAGRGERPEGSGEPTRLITSAHQATHLRRAAREASPGQRGVDETHGGGAVDGDGAVPQLSHRSVEGLAVCRLQDAYGVHASSVCAPGSWKIGRREAVLLHRAPPLVAEGPPFVTKAQLDTSTRRPPARHIRLCKCFPACTLLKLGIALPSYATCSPSPPTSSHPSLRAACRHAPWWRGG